GDIPISSDQLINSDEPPSWLAELGEIGDGGAERSRIHDMQEHVECRDDIKSRALRNRQRLGGHIRMYDEILGELALQPLDAGACKVQPDHAPGVMSMPKGKPKPDAGPHV